MADSFTAALREANEFLNSIVWGPPLLVLLIGTGVFFTVRTGFFQLRRAKAVAGSTALSVFKRKKSSGGKSLTQLQAFFTALASTIGTGNIAGVATALSVGGPGAVFWMWVSAFFGMMTSYAEKALGIYFRKKNKEGEWTGGPMYYLEEGLGRSRRTGWLAKPLAVLFCIFCLGASFGMGNMTQSNTIAEAVRVNYGIPALVTGIATALITGIVILGGIRRIGSVSSKLVPFMAVLYILACLAVFVTNLGRVPYVFSGIFKNAFSFAAIGGGVGGYAVQRAVSMGLRRGVFSNEAGLGASVMAHAVSENREPAVQGMWGIFEVFFDTIIVCTMTAFVLLSGTQNASSFEEALQNLTLEPQYVSFASADGEADGYLPLIDSETNEIPVVSETGEGQTVTGSAYGNPVAIPLATPGTDNNDNYIYTNIVRIRAVQAVGPGGEGLTDKDGAPLISSIAVEKVDGVALVSYAFTNAFGRPAGRIVTVCVILFAFTTLISWSYFGEMTLNYLFGKRLGIAYKIIFILCIVTGSVMSLELVWGISDTMNGLMAWPNLIGLLLLSGTVIRLTKNYTDRKIIKKSKSITPMLSAYPELQRRQVSEQAAEEMESYRG